jgi:ATP-dependent Lhr-like helicase
MKTSAAEFYKIVSEEAQIPFDPLELVYPDENPVFEKYDEYVPTALVRKGFALGVLDIEGMKKRVIEWGAPFVNKSLPAGDSIERLYDV